MFFSYLYILMVICGLLLRFFMYFTVNDKDYPKEKKISKFTGYAYIILGSIFYIVSSLLFN